MRYYKDGEIVIIQSVNYPHLNGKETEIILGKYGSCRDLATGNVCFAWYYMCDVPPLDNGEDSYWMQCALRKKHKGSDKSLEEILALCNSNPYQILVT